MNRIPVLLCGNAKVFDGMVICTLSIVKYHTGPIDLFLFTMDLPQSAQTIIPDNGSTSPALAVTRVSTERAFLTA